MIGLLLSLSLNGQSPNYIFESGFEGTSHVTQYLVNGNVNTDGADIEGIDNGYDWVEDLDNNATLGTFRIFYEQGDTSVSIAEIVEGPVNSGNHVLRYTIEEPHIDYTGGDNEPLQKGRIQASLNGNTNLTEFAFQVKLYLHPDIDSLKTHPDKITWFTLQEFWNNEAYQEYPFRVTLNLQKPVGVGSNLHFGAHGETKVSKGNWDARWEVLDTLFAVPTGEWMTLETHFVEGDSLHGKFNVTVTDSQNNIHKIVNITGFTQHPDDPDPDGVSSFNCMKLYTSGQLIEGMKALDANIAIYWDDFKLWTDSTSTGIKEETQHQHLNYYPNPTNSTVKLDSEIKVHKVNIYNSQGALVETLKEPSNEIDLRPYESGVYFIQVEVKDGPYKRLKVIKN